MDPAMTRPTVFSINYGVGYLVTPPVEPGTQQSRDMIAAMANAEGMTVMTAPGDRGAFWRAVQRHGAAPQLSHQ